MSTSERPTLAAFLTKTKTGHRILGASVLGGILVLVPMVIAKKKQSEASTLEAKSSSTGVGSPGGELPPSPSGFGDTLTLGQKYDALISRFGGDLTTTKTELDSTRKELEALRSTLRAERSSQAEEKKTLADTLRQLREGLGQAAAAPGSREISHDRERAGGLGGSLRSIELAGPTLKEKKEKRSVRIPAASGGRATLMNGVFAPVSGEPSPVRLRFDSAILGPNKARIPLRNSFLIGKATGDPNGCRVSIQIEKFSTMKETGESIETKALGFVVGDDGLEGVPGTYEWRAWEYMPLAVGTGALQGLSGALSQSQMTTTLNPLGGATGVLTGDSMKLAGYQAMGGASAKLGEIVAERMKEIRPAVSTPAARTVTVVFLDGVTLEGLETSEIDYGKENDPFRGLDSHR